MRKHFSQKRLAKCFSGYADCNFDDSATFLAECRNMFAKCPKLKKIQIKLFLEKFHRER